MSDVKVGELLTGKGHERDAIHIAIAPVVVGDPSLAPGQHVGLLDAKQMLIGIVDQPIGIVDPMLKGAVFQGQQVWLWLYPRSIVTLRHEWAHPAFPATMSGRVAAAKAALKPLMRITRLTETELLDAAQDFAENGAYTSTGSNEVYFDEIELDALWSAYETLRGKSRPPGERATSGFFSCAC